MASLDEVQQLIERALGHMREENAQLRSEVEAIRAEVARLRQLLDTNTSTRESVPDGEAGLWQPAASGSPAATDRPIETPATYVETHETPGASAPERHVAFDVVDPADATCEAPAAAAESSEGCGPPVATSFPATGIAHISSPSDAGAVAASTSPATSDGYTPFGDAAAVTTSPATSDGYTPFGVSTSASTSPATSGGYTPFDDTAAAPTPAPSDAGAPNPAPSDAGAPNPAPSDGYTPFDDTAAAPAPAPSDAGAPTPAPSDAGAPTPAPSDGYTPFDVAPGSGSYVGWDESVDPTQVSAESTSPGEEALPGMPSASRYSLYDEWQQPALDPNEPPSREHMYDALTLESTAPESTAGYNRVWEDPPAGDQAAEERERRNASADLDEVLPDVILPADRQEEGDTDWNTPFQELFERPAETAEERLDRSSAMFRMAQRFHASAQRVVKRLLHELRLPEHRRTISPLDVGGVAGGEKYLESGIFFKMARDWKGMYGGDAFAMKAASLELNNLAVYWSLADRSLHVPLAAILDYGGFRLMASSVLPIGGNTLVYGSSDQARTVHADDRRLNSIMHRSAVQLNLKPHIVGRGSQRRRLAACADIEVHAGRDQRYYVVDTARLFPPEAPRRVLSAFLIHCPSSEESGAGGVHVIDVRRKHAPEEMETILGGTFLRKSIPAGSLFVRDVPENHDAVASSAQESYLPFNSVASVLARHPVFGNAIAATGDRGQHLYNCLRPEFVGSCPRPLSSDAFTLFGWHGAAEHNAEVREATTGLLASSLPHIGHALVTGDLLPTHSVQLVEMLHERGVNMRHLGVLRADMGEGRLDMASASTVAERSIVRACLERIRSLIFTEMVSRVLKLLLREKWREQMIRQQDGAAAPQVAGETRAEANARRTSDMEFLRHELNAIFGRGSVSTDLWNVQVRIHTQLKFGSQSPALEDAEVRPDFDLRSRVALLSLAQRVAQQLGLRMSPRWILRLHSRVVTTTTVDDSSPAASRRGSVPTPAAMSRQASSDSDLVRAMYDGPALLDVRQFRDLRSGGVEPVHVHRPSLHPDQLLNHVATSGLDNMTRHLFGDPEGKSVGESSDAPSLTVNEQLTLKYGLDYGTSSWTERLAGQRPLERRQPNDPSRKWGVLALDSGGGPRRERHDDVEYTELEKRNLGSWGLLREPAPGDDDEVVQAGDIEAMEVTATGLQRSESLLHLVHEVLTPQEEKMDFVRPLCRATYACFDPSLSSPSVYFDQNAVTAMYVGPPMFSAGAYAVVNTTFLETPGSAAADGSPLQDTDARFLFRVKPRSSVRGVCFGLAVIPLNEGMMNDSGARDGGGHMWGVRPVDGKAFQGNIAYPGGQRFTSLNERRAQQEGCWVLCVIDVLRKALQVSFGYGESPSHNDEGTVGEATILHVPVRDAHPFAGFQGGGRCEVEFAELQGRHKLAPQGQKREETPSLCAQAAECAWKQPMQSRKRPPPVPSCDQPEALARYASLVESVFGESSPLSLEAQLRNIEGQFDPERHGARMRDEIQRSFDVYLERTAQRRGGVDDEDPATPMDSPTVGSALPEAPPLLSTTSSRAETGVPLVPLPCLVRALTLLGEICRAERRTSAAEVYYRRVLVALDTLGSGNPGVLPPFALSILDRLLRCLREEGRHHHTETIANMFASIWAAYPFPASLEEQNGWKFGSGIGSAAIRRVFGKEGMEATIVPRELNADRNPFLSAQKGLWMPRENKGVMEGVSEWVHAVEAFRDVGGLAAPLPPGGVVDLVAEDTAETFRMERYRHLQVMDPALRTPGHVLRFRADGRPPDRITSRDGILRELDPSSGGDTAAVLESGPDLAFVVTTGGQVLSFPVKPDGRVSQRQMGTGSSSVVEALGGAPVPLRSVHGKVIVDVSCGEKFTLLRDQLGRLFSFGEGSDGQLGHSDTAPRATPRVIEALDNCRITSIATGERHAVAVDDRGRVFSWGANDVGQLGLHHMERMIRPTMMDTLAAPVVRVRAVRKGTFLLSHDGVIFRAGRIPWGGSPQTDANVPVVVGVEMVEDDEATPREADPTRNTADDDDDDDDNDNDQPSLSATLPRRHQSFWEASAMPDVWIPRDGTCIPSLYLSGGPTDQNEKLASQFPLQGSDLVGVRVRRPLAPDVVTRFVDLALDGTKCVAVSARGRLFGMGSRETDAYTNVVPTHLRPMAMMGVPTGFRVHGAALHRSGGFAWGPRGVVGWGKGAALGGTALIQEFREEYIDQATVNKMKYFQPVFLPYFEGVPIASIRCSGDSADTGWVITGESTLDLPSPLHWSACVRAQIDAGIAEAEEAVSTGGAANQDVAETSAASLPWARITVEPSVVAPGDAVTLRWVAPQRTENDILLVSAGPRTGGSGFSYSLHFPGDREGEMTIRAPGILGCVRIVHLMGVSKRTDGLYGPAWAARSHATLFVEPYPAHRRLVRGPSVHWWQNYVSLDGVIPNIPLSAEEGGSAWSRLEMLSLIRVFTQKERVGDDDDDVTAAQLVEEDLAQYYRHGGDCLESSGDIVGAMARDPPKSVTDCDENCWVMERYPNPKEPEGQPLMHLRVHLSHNNLVSGLYRAAYTIPSLISRSMGTLGVGGRSVVAVANRRTWLVRGCMGFEVTWKLTCGDEASVGWWWEPGWARTLSSPTLLRYCRYRNVGNTDESAMDNPERVTEASAPRDWLVWVNADAVKHSAGMTSRAGSVRHDKLSAAPPPLFPDWSQSDVFANRSSDAPIPVASAAERADERCHHPQEAEPFAGAGEEMSSSTGWEHCLQIANGDPKVRRESPAAINDSQPFMYPAGGIASVTAPSQPGRYVLVYLAEAPPGLVPVPDTLETGPLPGSEQVPENACDCEDGVTRVAVMATAPIQVSAPEPVAESSDAEITDADADPMARSGPVHARLLREALDAYVAMYERKSVPRESLGLMLEQLSTSFKDLPILSLRAVIQQVKNL